MKKLFFLSLFCLLSSVIFAQPYILPDKQGQLWNVANGYYGTINANTVDASVALDSIFATTKVFYLAEWYRIPASGITPYDSARILKINKSGSGPYYQPYTWGYTGKGTLSITAQCYKASTSNTVTPTVTVTPVQSPDGIVGDYVTIPGITVATLSPTSRTASANCTFNQLDIYQRYFGVSVTVTDSASCRILFNIKAKTY